MSAADAPQPDGSAGAGHDAAVSPATGLGVLHLFCRPTEAFDPGAAVAAVAAAQGEGCTVVSAAMLGHKCDVGFLALHRDLRALRSLQTSVQRAGLQVVDSYVSLTELSEYAKGLPEEMARQRLYPRLPIPGKPAFCFYPMSKKREAHANWFTLDFERRKELMHDHGRSGRTFAGRVTQLVTGSVGLDDFEWGVTLFAQRPDDLKEVVYTMRFDEASALYAEFGPFYAGYVADVADIVAAI